MQLIIKMLKLHKIWSLKQTQDTEEKKICLTKKETATEREGARKRARERESEIGNKIRRVKNKPHKAHTVEIYRITRSLVDFGLSEFQFSHRHKKKNRLLVRQMCEKKEKLFDRR